MAILTKPRQILWDGEDMGLLQFGGLWLFRPTSCFDSSHSRETQLMNAPERLYPLLSRKKQRTKHSSELSNDESNDVFLCSPGHAYKKFQEQSSHQRVASRVYVDALEASFQPESEQCHRSKAAWPRISCPVSVFAKEAKRKYQGRLGTLYESWVWHPSQELPVVPQWPHTARAR